MLAVRVIPTLLLKGNGLVKGINFKSHRYVGDPINAVKIFNEKEVDEIVILDITATADGREPNYSLIADIASQAFMPLGYGGGISSTEQIEKLFRIGIEKVILNSACMSDLTLVESAVSLAGSQSIVVSIDIKKAFFGGYKVVFNSGKNISKYDPVEFAKAIEKAGAGEIILNSIDSEGVGKGYDLELIRKVTCSVGIPVVASGGAGKLSDFKDAALAGASAVAAGSLFTFHGKHRAVLITYPAYGELFDLFKGIINE